jgi:hypothetical protein
LRPFPGFSAIGGKCGIRGPFESLSLRQLLHPPMFGGFCAGASSPLMAALDDVRSFPAMPLTSPPRSASLLQLRAPGTASAPRPVGDLRAEGCLDTLGKALHDRASRQKSAGHYDRGSSPARAPGCLGGPARHLRRGRWALTPTTYQRSPVTNGVVSGLRSETNLN